MGTSRLIREPRLALLLVEDGRPLRDAIAAMLRTDPHPTAADFVGTLRSMSHRISVPAPSLSVSETPIAAAGATRRRLARTSAAAMTKREREVVTLLGEGLSNKEIGVRLHIALHTVKTHVHNVLAKLALHTRLEIAAYAHQAAGKA